MDLRPSTVQARFGAAARVLDAYAGQSADDGPGRLGAALTGFLRRTEPVMASVAAGQLRDLAGMLAEAEDAVPAPVRAALPRTPDGARAGGPWLETVADLLDDAVDHGFPEPGAPVSPWEWRQRFPALAQFLGCYFTQDLPDEFADHDAAAAAWLATASPVERARLTGEIGEALALGLSDGDLDEALATLGMDVEPPLPAPAWLRRVADLVAEEPA
ncbi:contact-dependent growth inhibition system immunity protein [Actinomadura napierensis]